MYEDISVELVDYMGTDLSVVNAARVSFNKKSKKLDEKDKKLIKYLAKHKHISPFGHCFLSFRVKAPIYVARQLMRHEYLRINEVSRRYVDSEPTFYMPEVRKRPKGGIKQGSGEVFSGKSLSNLLCVFNAQFKSSLDTYNNLINSGVAPEVARSVLPVSTMTEWIWSGSLDAFAKMCKMRMTFDTQAEAREVAYQIDILAEEKFPYSWLYLLETD